MGEKKMNIHILEHIAEYKMLRKEHTTEYIIKFCIWKKVLELSVKGPISISTTYDAKMFTLRCIELDLFDAFDPIALFFGDKK